MILGDERKPYYLRADQVFIRQGMSTYRAVRRMLQNKRVTVNGDRITEPGVLINTRSDVVCVDGEPIKMIPDLYFMMNKRQGTVCTSSEGQNVRIWADVSPEYLHPVGLTQLHTVGRLDIDTEGLLILTTDGLFSHRLTDPSSHVEKTYLVYLRDYCDEEKRAAYIEAFSKGIYMEKEKKGAAFTSEPAKLEWLDEENEYCNLVSSNGDIDFNMCLLKISEGKFHQVKRMFAAMGNEVIFLKRIATGDLKLDPKLLPGQYRPMTEEELALLV